MAKKSVPASRSAALAASTALPVAAAAAVEDAAVPDATVFGAVADEDLAGDVAAGRVTGGHGGPALVDGAVANAAAATATTDVFDVRDGAQHWDDPATYRPGETQVLLPASTGDGVVHEVSAVDALGLRDTGDDAAGDRAAANVSRPVAVAGAVVEPVNPGLGPHPGVDSDLAGDLAARSIVGADPVLPATSRTAFSAEGSAVAVDAMAADYLDTVAAQSVLPDPPSALEPAEGTATDFVVFDLTRRATVEERASLQLVLDHIQASFPDDELPAVSRPVPVEDQPVADFSLVGMDRAYAESTGLIESKSVRDAIEDGARWIRITSKVAGFRRGGVAHPAEPIDYRLDAFTVEQLESILAEPMLVTDFI